MKESASKITRQDKEYTGGGLSEQELTSEVSKLDGRLSKKNDKKNPLTPEQAELVEGGYENVKKIAVAEFFKIKNNRNNFQVDDFISWGTEGLIQAAKRFEAKKGPSFSSYSSQLIRGRILDNLRESSLISRTHMAFIKEHEKAVGLLFSELKRKPTEKEIAYKMGLSLKSYIRSLDRFPAEAGLAYIDAHSVDLENTDENYILDSMLQALDPYSPFVAAEYRQKEMELLKKFLKQLDLSEKEAEIVNMYFNEGAILRDIATKFGVTESRISQIRKKVIEELRVLFEKEGYKFNPENFQQSNNRKKKNEFKA